MENCQLYIFGWYNPSDYFTSKQILPFSFAEQFDISFVIFINTFCLNLKVRLGSSWNKYFYM